ncbi:mandelate racemase/muconate lactonizing enzyme family protein [Halobaculum litoreum]|uniref:Mandelate racemase/muconate lactonizing enzyme family protein n=1 Tax=Halobaculum litoreum TaxID=3031998 RepID=A0ABD5XUW4_9EURY
MGEAAPLPPWTEPAEACLAALRGARAAVDRDEPVAVDDLPPAAAHALSLAVADATARRDGRPLAASLAAEAGLDAPATAVPVNATVGDGSVDETVAAAEAAVADGFDCLKCKVGARGVAEDVDRLRAVRDAVGDAVGLRADANGAWRREEAERAVDALGGVALEYLEQPVAAGDHGALRALRGRGVPIAVDEAVNAPSGAEGWPDPVEEHADVAVLKPMAQGGPGATVAAARRLADRGVDTVVTTTIDAAVARAAAVHVAAAVPGGGDRAHGLATGGLLARGVVDDDPAPVADGRIAVPAGPGVAGEAFDGVV